MKKKHKIAIVAGGTGGHIYPAISLSEQLIREKKSVIFFSDTRVRRIIEGNNNSLKKNVKFYFLKVSRRFIDLFSNLKSFVKIFFLLKKENPKVVIAFGGYTSIPFLLISKILFKPIILHESNSIMGSANKLFYFFSKKVIFGWGDKKKK